jgi:hypothetical protein
MPTPSYVGVAGSDRYYFEHVQFKNLTAPSVRSNPELLGGNRKHRLITNRAGRNQRRQDQLFPIPGSVGGQRRVWKRLAFAKDDSSPTNTGKSR